MGEVLFAAPLYHKVHISIPWTLFKLAEQISSEDGEIMTMNVTDPNESVLCVNVHRKMEAGDEKLVIEVSDPEGLCEQGLVETDEESWRFDLGSVQSPVYLQKEDQIKSLSQEISISRELTSCGEKKPYSINKNMTVNPEVIQVGDDRGQDEVMYISSEHLAHLLESGDLIMKNKEQSNQEAKLAEITELSHIAPDEPEIIHGPEFACMDPSSEENSSSSMNDVKYDVGIEKVNHISDVEATDQASSADRIQNNFGMDDGTLVQFGVSDGDGADNESSQLSSLQSDSVVIVEQQPESLISVRSDQMESYVVMSAAVASDTPETTMKVEGTSESKWNVNDPEMSIPGRGQMNDLEPMDLYSTQGESCVRDEPKPASRTKKVANLASDLSLLMVQSVKDIPRIIRDVEAFKCSVCARKFYSVDVLHGHFQRLHREHVYNEKDVEKITVKGAFLCFICRHPFRRFDAVRKHLESVHKLQMERRKIVRQNVCPLCLSKHSSLRTLRCHLNYKHHDHPQYRETLVAVHTQLCLERKPKHDNRILLHCPFCSVNLRFKQFVHHLRIAHHDDPNYEEILHQSRQAMKEQKRRRLHETTKECKYCHKEFPLTRFYSHLRNTHHTERNEQHKCPTCGKTFHSNWHLNMHRLTHTEERSQKCDICGHCFRHVYSLKKHKKTIHEKEYPFPCHRCGRGFHTRTLFRNHRCKPKSQRQNPEGCVTGEEDVKCTGNLTESHVKVCDNIKLEETSEVPLNVPVTCDTATVAVPTPKDVLSLPVHNTGPAVRALALKSVRTQNSPDVGRPSDGLISGDVVLVGDAPNCKASPSVVRSIPKKAEDPLTKEADVKRSGSCQRSDGGGQLGTQVVASQAKYRHVDPQTGNQVCDICGKQFKNLMSISTHLRRVHHISRKPINKYRCDVCGREFVLQSKLNSHMQIHENQTVACSQCGRVLRGKYLLEKHIRVVHRRQYLYNCTACGRGFEKQRCLREHRCGRRSLEAGQRVMSGAVQCREASGPGSRTGTDKCSKSKEACEAMLALSKTSSGEGVSIGRSNAEETDTSGTLAETLTSGLGATSAEAAGVDGDLLVADGRTDTGGREGGTVASHVIQGVGGAIIAVSIVRSEDRSDTDVQSSPVDCGRKSEVCKYAAETGSETTKPEVLAESRGVAKEESEAGKAGIATGVTRIATSQPTGVVNSGSARRDKDKLRADEKAEPKRSKRTRSQPSWLQAYNS